MRAFTLYLDRDVPIECDNDRQAVELARRVHETVDEVIAELGRGMIATGGEYARTTCQRGTHNKRIYDEERGVAIH